MAVRSPPVWPSNNSCPGKAFMRVLLRGIRRNRRRDDAVASFLSTATMLLVLLSIDATEQAIHPSVGSPNEHAQPAYVDLWPQQWEFFSNFADRDTVTGYAVEGAGAAFVPVAVLHASRADLWGLGSSSDALMSDLLFLASSVPTTAWTDCGALLERKCFELALTKRPVTVVDRYPVSSMCGIHVLAVDGHENAAGSSVRRRPVIKTVRVSVRCTAS